MAAVGQKFCVSCGQQINEKAEICPKCGVRQPSLASGGRSRVTAGILGILLGGLGVHKFYLGQTGLGIIYILFSWTFIPLIVGFIEGITYLTMNDADFNAKYNS